MNPLNQPTPRTEAHRKLWSDLYKWAHREIFEDYAESSEGPATQLIADSEARAVERATIDTQAAGNALFYAIYERMKPHFPDGSRDLDWDVLPSTVGATCKALAAERERVRVLETALRSIAVYGERHDGCCPYGCDTPTIATTALAATAQEGSP